MLQKLLQIAGVSTKEEFYKKYPTEESFFRAHPEAKQLLSKKSQQPSMMATPQAMYGMGMAFGGRVLPRARYGMQPQGDPEPINSDYPTYEAFKAAHDNWLASQQEQANNPTQPPVEETSAAQPAPQPGVTYPVYDADGNIGSYVDSNGNPVSVNPNTISAAPAASATSFKLNDYQGGSVYDFLSSQGKAGDFKSRKKLAQALGMSNYKGTPTQNADMMEMIRQNPDILSSYDDSTAPQATITRTAAQTQNKKAAPTTQQLSNSKSVAATGKPNVNWNNVPLMPNVTVVSKRKWKTMPEVKVYGKTVSPLQRAVNNSTAPGVIRRNVQTQQWEPVLVGSGPSAENAQRIKLAQQKNAEEAGNTLGLPQFRQQKMGGEPCYNCGGMYEEGGMAPEGRALVNTYGHGGYYGNVPQHGNPGVYADGTSGTFNGGQGFAFGGFLGDVSNGMRDGSLQALAGSILPMANIYQDKLSGSPITGKMSKLDENGQPIKDNSDLKDELNKYLSNLTGEIKKEDLQSIVGKYALGGMASQGYIPEYGSQSYGGFAYGGVPLPQYNMGSNYYPEGGEVSPEDQAAMDMQQAQQAPPQEGGAPPEQGQQGGGQMDPQQIIQAVSQMIQQGMQPQEIMQQLVQMGIPQQEAQQLIQAVMQQMQGGQGPQEEMAEGAQGQEAPPQEAMEGQMPPMGRWGGKFGNGGWNTTTNTTEPPIETLPPITIRGGKRNIQTLPTVTVHSRTPNNGIGNLSKFVGQPPMAEPSLEAMHAAAMRNPYYNMNPNTGGIRKLLDPGFYVFPPSYNPNNDRGFDVYRKPSGRALAEGGMIGEEMDVTPEQMEYLRKQGYKFDII